MSTGVIIILAVAALVIVALVLAPRVMQSGGGGLKRRFGPEYERTVAHHNGDRKAAERELSERLRRHGDLRTRPLSAEAREQYVARWAGVQEQFVDSPSQAVDAAERLLGELIRERGFPADEYDEQVAALSVHHSHHVDGYRHVHAVAARARDGRAETEELREAVVHARALFEELVTTHPQDNARHRAGDRGTERHGARTPAAGAGKQRLTERLQGPWAARHNTGTTKGGA
ncbi:preprotein translocase subunit SecG [Streptomyces albus]|uniref:preprotein translocase subunit SecG n=1 Tax=Streptomyces albus TaxID=1888 RepID=UPI00068985FE|nr:preprotein translocase subunit SecG [Streptomyces albus]